MDFIYLFRVLLKRKWIILLAGLAAGILAFFLTKNEPRKFLSRTQIATGFTLKPEYSMNDKDFSYIEADTKFNNTIVAITSQNVMELLADTLILHDLQSSSPFRKLKEGDLNSDTYKNLNKAEAIAVFREKLQTLGSLSRYNPKEKQLLDLLKLYKYDTKNIAKSLNAYQLQRTDYLQIDFVSENPLLSAFGANGIYEQFMRYDQRLKTSNLSASIDTLQSIMEKKKAELEAKNQLVRLTGGIASGDGASSRLDVIGALEQQLSSERARRIALQSDLRKIDQKISTAGIYNQPTTPTTPANNDQLMILRNQKNEAYRKYLNSGSQDKDLFAEYNRLNEEYIKLYTAQKPTSSSNTGKVNPIDVTELKIQRADVEIDIQASGSTIATLQSQINGLKGNLSQDVNAESIQKEAEQANNEYLEAKKKYDDAKIVGSSSATNFKQISVGQPALEPEPSKAKLIVAMAIVAAMITTILILILLTYLDTTIKTPGIFSKSVGVKLVSMVNFMNLKDQDLAEIVTKRDTHKDAQQNNRHNVFRESIRKLRYAIETSGKQIFMFTSTKKGQGKTTLIQAVSHSLSLSKKKILVIDTNFCNNDLTVQMNGEPVLEKILPQDLKDDVLADNIKSLAKEVGKGSVFLIGSEGGDYTPSEILPRENLLKHLQALKSEFDYIFLEGPPLNDFSDSKELSQYVEGVIGIFSAQQVIKQIDKESITFFKELNGKFTGAVLNMVDLENVNVT